MKLYEAIEKFLQQTRSPMTTQQIADALNKNGWYKKKNGFKISASQIHGRTKNYPNLFARSGSSVFLIGQKSRGRARLQSPKRLARAKENLSAKTKLA